MTCPELIEITKKGEDSYHQFKAHFTSIDKLAVEISAFANSEGGRLFVGVSDKGRLTGLTFDDLHRLNQWTANASSSKIEPPLFVKTEIIMCQDKRILIISVPHGTNKPYAVNKTEFWVKNGADKRRASREELFRLMQSSHLLYADELETDAAFEDFNVRLFNLVYEKYYEEELKQGEISLEKLLHNLKLMKGGHLTLAGLLLFGKRPEIIKPQFVIRAVYFEEDDISIDSYRDAENISGTLAEQFQRGVFFINRNLRRIQGERDFNAPPVIEIPHAAFSEAVANAIVHRDYFINAPVFIYLFPSRVEVISPGTLPNTVTEESIRYGIHIERNPTILSFLEKDEDFTYSGRGTGIPRLIRKCRERKVKVDFINNRELQQFKVVFYRSSL